MKKIIEQLKKQDNFAVFTHISPDGDALGSLFALVHVLRKMGKRVDAYVAGAVPKRLLFLAKDFGGEYYTEPMDKRYDCCVSVDCADELRLGVYREMYMAAPVTINIDHHITNKGFAKYNLVQGHASSNGEVLFPVFEEMQVWDACTASLVYAAIASDTGSFGFSNTSAFTHTCAAKLIEYGANHAEYSRLLFYTNSKSALRAQAYTINNMEYYFNGKVALATVSDETLAKIGATKEDSEGLVNILKGAEDVEVGILLKEFEDRTKVSMRTSNSVDASVFMAKFGGGGHARAAGCTLNMPLEQAKDTVLKALEEFI